MYTSNCEKPLEILTYLKKHKLLLACVYVVQKANAFVKVCHL